MRHRTHHGRQNQEFVCGEIELDTRQIAPTRRYRSTVADTRFAATDAAVVVVNIEPPLFRRQFQTGGFIDPVGEISETFFEKTGLSPPGLPPA